LLNGLTANAKSKNEKQKLKAAPRSNRHTGANRYPVYLALAFAVSFDSVCPLSVALQSRFCQGEMHRDVHFSMDKPGRRIHAALKQSLLCEGGPKGQRDRGVFSWLLLLYKQKTKSHGAILNSRSEPGGRTPWMVFVTNSPAGEKGIFRTRTIFRKQ